MELPYHSHNVQEDMEAIHLQTTYLGVSKNQASRAFITNYKGTHEKDTPFMDTATSDRVGQAV